MTCIRAKTPTIRIMRVLDDGFFLALFVIKSPDLGGVISGCCHKVANTGAETGTEHPIKMQDGCSLLALPGN